MKLQQQLQNALIASRKLIMLEGETVKKVLLELAQQTRSNTDFILQENKKDLERMDSKDPRYDRLKLTTERVDDIAAGIENVANLPNPVGRVLKEEVRPNGLKVKKVSVPFGIIGVIYEARPNVTLDVFALCFKSGSACVLKGGSDAIYSNRAIASIIQKVLKQFNLDENSITLLSASREDTNEMLKAREYIDLVIPRGSQGLIDFVRKNSTIPVIETGAGICHTYFDELGDIEKGKEIIFNAKTRRPAVCNTLECLIIHESRLHDLPALTNKLAEENVLIHADSKSFAILKDSYPPHLLQQATSNDYGKEFLALEMAVKTVANFDNALTHIFEYGSKHSEAIISECSETIDKFQKMVDASSVYSNASTAFTDGAQFGLGAEIGISTQKLHARGPMGLEELTSYKWIVEGTGQVRSK